MSEYSPTEEVLTIVSSIRCAKCNHILCLEELDRGRCYKCEGLEKDSKEPKDSSKLSPQVKNPILLLVCPRCLEDSLIYDEVTRVFLCLNRKCLRSYVLAEYKSWEDKEGKVTWKL